MFVFPIFWGCKYTNYFLFINKNIEFQHFDLLISFRKFERCDKKELWKPTGNG